MRVHPFEVGLTPIIANQQYTKSVYSQNKNGSVKYQLSAVLNYRQLPTIEVCVSKTMNLRNARLFFLVNAVNGNATFV